MLRWLTALRRKRRRADHGARPEVELVRMLSRQISMPEKAGPVLRAVEAFEDLHEAARRSELPRIYLLLEQYLTDVDPVRTLTRGELRETACSAFPDLVRQPPFNIVFEQHERQEVLLCRYFLLDVLDRAIHVLGGGSNLSFLRSWISEAPDRPSMDLPLDADMAPPSSDASWMAAMMRLSQTLFEQLRVGLGEATAGIYDAAYATLAYRYAGLETFPVVVRLLPDGLLDEQRIQSLARHGTMSRVQGELSEAQRTALETERQFQAVLNTVGEGIVTVDAGGSIVLINPQFERTFGYAADDLIGTPIDRLLRVGADSSAFFGRLGETVSAKGQRRDGSAFPVELSVNETIISDQVFYTAAVRDVTVRRQYERDLLRAKEHAEEMTRLKTAFLANMSHEIRTPLSGIMGAVQILHEEVSEEHREFTRMADQSARRLLSTLDAVLEFARLEAGKIDCTCKPVPVAPLLKDAAASFSDRAREKGLALEVRVDPVTVAADPEGLRRIVDALLENAIRFTHRGRVLLAAQAQEGRVRIEVRDEGTGISASFLPHVFDEFRQESMGHSRTHEGTGLGLAIARRHAEAMGGRIRAESTPGRGSTFTLDLALEASSAHA